MAHFKKPPKTPAADYDLSSKPPHAVAKMRLAQLTWRPVIIWGEERLFIDSGNRTVLPLEGISSGPYNSSTAERLLQLFGRQAGKSNVVAKLNVAGKMKDWTAPMEVSVIAHRLFRVRLESKHMVLNSHDMSRSARFEMDETVLVPKDMKPDELFKLIKTKASKKLKHLVFNCHGFIGQIEIFGKKSKAVLDESNVHLFAELKGLVGTIWITSCAVGHELCEQIANRADCNVVGANAFYPVTGIKLTKGQFDFHIGCSPTAISGKKATAFGDFVMKGHSHGFYMEMARSEDPFSN